MTKGKLKVYESEEGYNLYASNYDDSLKYLDSFEKGKFYELCGDIKEKSVIDLGAGTGRLTPWLLMGSAHVLSVDISEEMLKILKKKYFNSEILVSDVLDLSKVEDESKDIATAAFLIVHIADKNLLKFFDEVNRVLKTGGYFILSNINQRKAPKLGTKDKGNIQIKSYYHIPEKVVKKLKEAFFEIESEEFVEEDGVWINQVIRARKI